MGERHIFVASGEACPICVALDGQEVEAGHQAHDGCLCQTIPIDKEPGCEWDFEQVGNSRDGNGPFDVITGFEVTVICPDGSKTGATGSFDGHPYNAIPNSDEALDKWSDDFSEAAEELAQELCDDCPEPPPFLCC